MATIRERLTEFAETQGFRTLSGFERACGFTKNTLTKDREGISSNTLVRIVGKYPQLSLDWVILGRGAMLVDESPQCAQNDIHHNQQVVITNLDGFSNALAKGLTQAISQYIKEQAL